MFSPPYGDGTNNEEYHKRVIGFSPPYGDGTSEEIVTKSYYPFSPPYGDGTLNISQNIVKWKS